MVLPHSVMVTFSGKDLCCFERFGMVVRLKTTIQNKNWSIVNQKSVNGDFHQ